MNFELASMIDPINIMPIVAKLIRELAPSASIDGVLFMLLLALVQALSPNNQSGAGKYKIRSNNHIFMLKIS